MILISVLLPNESNQTLVDNLIPKKTLADPRGDGWKDPRHDVRSMGTEIGARGPIDTTS